MTAPAAPGGQPGGASAVPPGAAGTSAPEAEPAPPENPIVVRVREAAPDALERDEEVSGQLVLRVARDKVVQVCELLRDDPNLRFDHLTDVTAVDYASYNPEGGPLGEGRTPRFDVVYHLYSIQKNNRVRLKVGIDEGEEVPSVTGVWASANWGERETYDMYGIVFTGHPNLSRILMPDDWQGHPLRKDYPLIEEEIEFTSTLGYLNEQRRR